MLENFYSGILLTVLAFVRTYTLTIFILYILFVYPCTCLCRSKEGNKVDKKLWAELEKLEWVFESEPNQKNENFDCFLC